MIKIFTHIPNHPTRGDYCEGVPQDEAKHFQNCKDGVYQVPGSLDMYVLTQAGEFPTWEHPEAGDVALWNTHPTGELRWSVRFSDNSGAMVKNEFRAVRFFGIKLKSVTDERWAQMLIEQEEALKAPDAFYD